MKRFLPAYLFCVVTLSSGPVFSVTDDLRDLLEDTRFTLKKELRTGGGRNGSGPALRTKERIKHLNQIAKNIYEEDQGKNFSHALEGGLWEVADLLLSWYPQFNSPESVVKALSHDEKFATEGFLYDLFRDWAVSVAEKPQGWVLRKSVMGLLSSRDFSGQSELLGRVMVDLKLLESDLMTSNDQNRNLPLMKAVCANNTEMIDSLLPLLDREILDHKNRFGWQLLHCAAMFADRSNLLKIMEKKPDLRLQVYSYTFNRKVRAFELLEKNERLSYEEKKELLPLLKDY